MRLENFRRYWEWVNRMTVDFVEVVPGESWDFTPVPRRMGRGFAPFCRQVRHVICVRGVYTTAMVTRTADFSRSHDHYTGSLRREELLAALIESDRQFLATLNNLDTSATIDFGGTPFSFDDFACEVVQHEGIHHGQWSIYAALAGFETPMSWRSSWKL